MDERQVGGLWCHQVLELLDGFIEGTLEAGELSAVQAHVAGCDSCARFGAAYARLVDVLRRDTTEEVPDDAVLERLRLRLQRGVE